MTDWENNQKSTYTRETNFPHNRIPVNETLLNIKLTANLIGSYPLEHCVQNGEERVTLHDYCLKVIAL